MDNFMSVLSFIKSFKGPATIDGKTIETIFYNEREWRSVPTKEEIREIHGSVQVGVQIISFVSNFTMTG